MLPSTTEVTSSKYFRVVSALLQASVVAVACWWLSPLDTRTVFAAASEYVQTSGFGPYDRLVYSHLHQRPFEYCQGAEQRHVELLTRVSDALPAIEASSRFELVRLFRLIRTFNRETQTFYTTRCPSTWSYFYTYVDYQSSLMKVAPAIWVLDALHRSEIYIIVVLIVGSWFGIFSLFWVAKRLTGSAIVGGVTLAALWFSLDFFSPGLYADLRLNVLNTFALVGVAQFLCELPPIANRIRRWAVELSAALAFAVSAMLLTFLRMPSTKLDAIAVIACVFAVAAVRRSPAVLRRAILVVVMVTAVQWPYQTFSKSLLAPVGAVNTAAAEEYKVLSAVQFLTERPSHFGNFILDYNFTWMFDADYYLIQLSPVSAMHHGFPAWGRKFLQETVLHHPTELPNAWWKRFLIQTVYHDQLSYGIYRNHQTAGTVTLWLAVTLIAFLVLRGRRLAACWPLVGLVLWEVFGLHTFLGLMHIHSVYIAKGIPLLWTALPSLAFLGVREGVALASKPPNWRWPARINGWSRRLAVVGVAVVLVVGGGWAVREYRKEVHAMRVWRAVHAGQYLKEAYLSPEDLVREVDAIRDLGGNDPGTVSMYGAWALFGYLERLGNYNKVTGGQLQAADVKRLQMELYQRAVSEAPENPHFYPYARYLEDPNKLQVFRTALERFPEHPYAIMMSYFVGAEDPSLTFDERVGYYKVYDDAIRRQLKASSKFRPGLRELPAVVASGPVVQTADGVFTTLLPGEVAKIEPFQTWGTDRLAIGVFLKVAEGQVTVHLDGQPDAKLFEGPVVTNAATTSYRAWHFTGLEADPQSSRTATTGLVLQAGPQGARFTIRDLYPIIENPRWFR